MPERVTTEAIATFDRLGVGGGLNYVARLFDGHGQENHGGDGWRDLCRSEFTLKTLGHVVDAVRGRTADHDSGMHPMAHVAGRALMYCTKWVERGRLSA